LESVSKWISVQDDSVRAAIATQLVDDVQEIVRAAREQGLAAGRTAGREAAEKEAARYLELLESINRGAEAAFASQSAALADQCVDIVALAIARMAGPLLSSREAATGAVLEVLAQLEQQAEVVIRVAGPDLPVLEESRELIKAALAGKPFSLVADKRVEEGGALVETAQGALDGRFEVQLRELSETLRAVKAMRVDEK
jgi:flagellar biosynthesis/type III secretory pathway protein FliH